MFTLPLPKENLTKPWKLLNPELSNEGSDYSNESSRWVVSNGGVHIDVEQTSFSRQFYVQFEQNNMAVKELTSTGTQSKLYYYNML